MSEQRSTRTSTATKGTRARASSADGGRGPGTRVGPEDAARSAYAWLDSSIAHHIEGVSAVRRTDQGWCVALDVLEVPRIPDTTSLLATYEVELDERGRPAEYRRTRRYQRGAADG